MSATVANRLPLNQQGKVNKRRLLLRIIQEESEHGRQPEKQRVLQLANSQLSLYTASQMKGVKFFDNDWTNAMMAFAMLHPATNGQKQAEVLRKVATQAIRKTSAPEQPEPEPGQKTEPERPEQPEPGQKAEPEPERKFTLTELQSAKAFVERHGIVRAKQLVDLMRDLLWISPA